MQCFKKKSLLVLFLVLSLSVNTIAQDSLVRQLKEITISATRTEKNILSTGRSVSVITAEDIANRNYTTLAELLSQEEGIYITGTGQTPGSNESVFLRGANSNQTAIYIDGVRITDASTVNNTIDLSEVSIQNIERIEILRGSHSTLYGSSAIGGVINITTGVPKETGFHSTGGISTGTFGSGTLLINPFVNAGYSFQNGLHVSTMVDFTSVNGLDATTDTVIDPTIYKKRDDDNWKKINSGFMIGYKRLKTDAFLNYTYGEMDTDIDDGAYNDDDNYKLKFKRHTISGQFKQQLKPDFHISLAGGLAGNERLAINDSSIVSADHTYDHQYTEDKYTGKTANADLMLHRKWKNIDLVLGAGGSLEQMTADNYVYSATFAPFIYENHSELKVPLPSTNTTSFFGQVDMKGTAISEKFKKFNLVVGSRYSYNDLFKENIAFEINPSYNIGKKSLVYFSYSTGYNAPSLYQLHSISVYTPWDGSSGTGISLGNESLQPEKSKCAEIGFKRQINETGIISLSVFNRKLSDQIEYVYMWNGAVPVDSLGSDPFGRDDFRGDTYINAGEGNSYGVEITLLMQIVKNLVFNGGISLVDGEMLYKGSDELTKDYNGNHLQLYNNGKFLSSTTQKQKGLIRRPNMLRLELSYSGIKKLNINLATKFVDDRDDVYYDTQIKPQGALNTIAVEEYFLIDLNMAYSLTKHILISARIENMLDKEYSEIRGFNTRGRGLYLKLAYKI